ncbi:unnamed protein product [Bemisia tabaci]|uniref:Glycosyltransferase 2-like domain-containing protein n=1 Tax=Bemisia tabaci TaxID=7038 RepID=A0A9P0AM53_BEMTA|nr:unnamed protein product [Bemisia tabaci]
MLSSRTKHLLHCALLLTVIVLFEIFSGGVKVGDAAGHDFDPWLRYGALGCTLLYLLRFLAFLPLPQTLANLAGLTLYNAFPDRVVLHGSPLLAPFICIRIVTRGDYPQLVRANVVTDKAIGLPSHNRVRETVVPPHYRTKSGALYKARALQYCLEEGVNMLSDSDWIVHLDEETLLTENSVRGILNFVISGRHHFGQGLITYANEEVVNWVTTLADSFRVADDMGKLRLQFSIYQPGQEKMKSRISEIKDFRNQGFQKSLLPNAFNEISVKAVPAESTYK